MSINWIDFDNYEGRVLLAADRRRGVWANETLFRGSRNVRNAGQVPTTASSHTLLTVALTAALRNIHKAAANRLVSTATQKIKKPRLLVASIDATFCDALKVKMKRTGQNGPAFRAGKNFLMALAQQLVRFEITLHTGERPAVLTLKNWSWTAIIDPKTIPTIPPVLLPSAVSTLV